MSFQFKIQNGRIQAPEPRLVRTSDDLDYNQDLTRAHEQLLGFNERVTALSEDIVRIDGKSIDHAPEPGFVVFEGRGWGDLSYSEDALKLAPNREHLTQGLLKADFTKPKPVRNYPGDDYLNLKIESNRIGEQIVALNGLLAKFRIVTEGGSWLEEADMYDVSNGWMTVDFGKFVVNKERNTLTFFPGPDVDKTLRSFDRLQ